MGERMVALLAWLNRFFYLFWVWLLLHLGRELEERGYETIRLVTYGRTRIQTVQSINLGRLLYREPVSVSNWWPNKTERMLHSRREELGATSHEDLHPGS